MTVIRKEIRFRSEDESEFSYAYLNKYMDQYPGLSINKVIELIFEEHSSLKEALSKREEVSDNISKDVLEKIKPTLDVIRVRSGYIDKNTRAMLLLANSFIIMNALDDKLPIKELDVVSRPVKEAQEKITEQIQSYRTKKLHNEGSKQ